MDFLFRKNVSEVKCEEMKYLLFAAAVWADFCAEKLRIQARDRNDTIFIRNELGQSKSGSCHYHTHITGQNHFCLDSEI